MFISTFCFIFSILGCLEYLAMNCSILSLLLTDSPIPSKRFSKSVTNSKYVLKVLGILCFLRQFYHFQFSETILSFSINAILEPPSESLFEKYGLQVFQNGLVAVLTFDLSKDSLLHSLFILTTKLSCFL